MLKLFDVIHIPKQDLHKYKLHLAIGPKEKKEPLYELFKGNFKTWQEGQSKKNFERDYIISLIYYNRDEWIFGGIYKQKGVKKIGNRFKYDTELIDSYRDFIGRLIIRFRRPGRQSYLNLEKWADRLGVIEILRKPYSVDPFPGYENVVVDFDLLKTIIEKEEPSWKAALSSVKGVYIITDKINGKIYVGSAYGDDSFWSRWSIYIRNRHGGNKELKKIIDEKGLEYASNFQFSILEVRSPVTDKDEIIKREMHWKNALKSREFGYNEN
ncbi:GIY-YIG nuclease family protein [bacterium]|nr:GIY-YIG nuclease family protein [bacterium]